MTNSQAKEVKKGKLKMFFIFLFVSTFIWFLSKFSNEFTATVEASIVYTNVPNDLVISDKNPKQIIFDLTASGFDFLYNKINPPVIQIDIKNYYKSEKESIIISKNELKKIISSQLKNKSLVQNISMEAISVKFDQLAKKKIPVLLVENISYKNGFSPIENLKLTPDSVQVIGPSSLIDTISKILTEKVILNNIDSNINEEVKLIVPPETSIEKNKVTLFAQIKEFTQESIKIPVVVKNVPEEITLKLIPETVTINFEVVMEDFNKYSENDFMVICDYSKRNKEEGYLLPVILKSPENIKSIEISENKINYLIFK